MTRLQTFPDDWNEFGVMGGQAVKISDTQRYKQLGNSFTVEVIKHILSFIALDKNQNQEA